MSQSYADYERDYTALLSRVRSFLSSTRSRSSLLECERLLDEARKCAVAMHGLAEIQGNPILIQKAQQRQTREIAPLSREISSALQKVGNVTYQAPSDVEFGSSSLEFGSSSQMDTERLIAYSNDLLLESQALCAETEQIGSETLSQMGRQREQLLVTNQYLSDTSELTVRARQVLQDMRNKGLRSKVVLYVLIFVLIIANGWVLHWLFNKK